MSDEELVVAQGQENNQRRDLTFIERVRYAAGLDSRGFSRAVVTAALDAHSADITRYLAVAHRLPGVLIEVIGPAPKAGRPRWLALADALPPGRRMPPEVRALVERPDFAAMPSDARFAAVLAVARQAAAAASAAGDPGSPLPSPSRPSAADALWRSADGALAAGRRRLKAGAGLDLTGPEAEAFADWLGGRLEALHGEFRRGRADAPPEA
jgi:ParB family chromosome partitioning protein